MGTERFVVRFLLAAFAVWRMSHLLAHEDGPGDLALKLRLKLGAAWSEHSLPDGRYEAGWEGIDFWSKLICCPLCLSVWLAVPFALWVGSFSFPSLVDAVVTWLAISGAASALELLVYRD